MKLKKVIIFTAEKFPYGMAATNRIISYGKGFIANDLDVEVICFRRTENYKEALNTEAMGVYQGVPFRYLSGSPIKSKSFMIRRFHNILALFAIISYAFKHIDSTTASIYYSDKSLPGILVYLVNKIKGGVFLKEESEHPKVYLKTKNFFSKVFFKNSHYQLFDGYLLMTKTLVNYFKSKYSKPFVQVPMTVELDRFTIENAVISNGSANKQVVYTGVLDDNKDGIDILIKAFSKIAHNFKDFDLSLYGSAQSKESMSRYEKMVEELQMSNRIHFKGRVPREVITKVLMDAKILVLPRPDSLQARNGFPTKLGEYLATGNPTIVTDVGEIPDYLTDRKDVFMAKNNNVTSLHEKLLEVLNDYNNAKEIGLKGRKTAEVHFSNINQTKKIINFIKTSFN